MPQNTSYHPRDYPRDAYQRERPGRSPDEYDRAYPMGMASDSRRGSDVRMPADMRPESGRDDYDQDPWRYEGGQTEYDQRPRNTQQIHPPRSAEGRRWDAPSRQGRRYEEYRAQFNRSDLGPRGSDPYYYERQGFGGQEDQQQRDFGWEPMYQYQPEGRMGGVGHRMAGNRQSSQSQRGRSQAGMQRERSFRGMGPRGYRRSDDRIHEDVCDRLTDHSAIDPSDIEIKVSNGEVTLEGTVENRRMKHLVEDIADDIPGVTDVHNRLKVSGRRSGSHERSATSGENREEEEGNGPIGWSKKSSKDKSTHV